MFTKLTSSWAFCGSRIGYSWLLINAVVVIKFVIIPEKKMADVLMLYYVLLSINSFSSTRLLMDGRRRKKMSLLDVFWLYSDVVCERHNEREWVTHTDRCYSYRLCCIKQKREAKKKMEDFFFLPFFVY
jgi:hypothetical protein